MPQGTGFFLRRLPNASLRYPIILIKQSTYELGMETRKNSIGLIPGSEKSLLLSRYWGAWLSVFTFIGIAPMPFSFRDPILGKLGRSVGRLVENSRCRVQINLLYRFPEKSGHEREAIIDAMYTSTPQVAVMMAELGLRGS